MSSTTNDRSNTTIDANDNEQCQQLADDAIDNKRRWHNELSQQQRTMPAITNDRSNNTSCQQPRTMSATRRDDRIMPVTTRDASNYDRRQLQLAMPAIIHDRSNHTRCQRP